MLRRTGTCVCDQQHERRQRQSGQPKVVLLLRADAIGVTAPLWYLAGWQVIATVHPPVMLGATVSESWSSFLI